MSDTKKIIDSINQLRTLIGQNSGQLTAVQSSVKSLQDDVVLATETSKKDIAALGTKLDDFTIAVTENYSGLVARLESMEKKFESTATFDDRGGLHSSNQLQMLNSLYAFGLPDNADAAWVRQEMGKFTGDIWYNIDMIKVYKQKNGRMAAKIYAAPVVRQELLMAWRSWSKAHGQAVRSAQAAKQPPPEPLTSLQLREDLTRAGQEQFARLQSTYSKLKEQGQYPLWRNGAELWYRPNGRDSNPVPYHQAGASPTGSPTATPARGDTAKRGADTRTPGTDARVNAMGNANKKKTKGDVHAGDQEAQQ